MVKMKFQWFFDIATIADTMQILSVSAGGEMVRRRLAPFFGAYKYFKLGNVSLKLVPASTLPVDPTGLSYEAGENTVDPRDQLNPGLTRITNGEDVFDDLSIASASEIRQIYYNMMLDPRWFKWSLQSGLQRSARPLYWQIGQLHQDYFPGATINVGARRTDVDNLTLAGSNTHYIVGGNIENTPEFVATDMYSMKMVSNSDPRGLFQTGHKGKLGWLPTDALAQWVNAAGESASLLNSPAGANIPEVDVFKIILPPAYKTKYYYRAYVTETVYFKTPVYVNAYNYYGEAGASYNPLDRFVYNQQPKALLPVYSGPETDNYPPEGNNGQGEVNYNG